MEALPTSTQSQQDQPKSVAKDHQRRQSCRSQPACTLAQAGEVDRLSRAEVRALKGTGPERRETAKEPAADNRALLPQSIEQDGVRLRPLRMTDARRCLII